MLFYKKDIGNLGEAEAARYLKKHGLKIIKKNFKNRYGEIDLIAKDKKTVVFVEVKTRTSTDYGTAATAVNKVKQRKIITVAKTFLNEKTDTFVRFDIVEVYLDRKTHKTIRLNHIINAFEE